MWNRYANILIGASLLLASCTKYLDEKPDKSLSVPDNLSDLQLLLDNNGTLNNSCPSAVEMCADNFYMSNQSWNALTNVVARDYYTWDKDAATNIDYNGCYRAVAIANVVLDAVKEQPASIRQETAWRQVKGSALFFRSYAFFLAAQLYAPVYDEATASSLPGLPLRLNSDLSERSTRASLEQVYNQLIHDLQESLELLPAGSLYKTRPTSVAAWGLLARCYLAMENYPAAYEAAGKALNYYNSLLDYNKLNAAASTPFARFNTEVIFHSRMLSGSSLTASTCKVDTLLLSSYESNDIRRTIFFRVNADGSRAFKGNYDGQVASTLFNGICTSELYLVMAESAIRTNRWQAGMDSLNVLLRNRYSKNNFVPKTAGDASQALQIVLAERRKEMIFRGQRWSDLRRFNKHAASAVTLKRNINGVLYELPPADPRWVLLFPLAVIELSGMEQNKR